MPDEISVDTVIEDDRWDAAGLEMLAQKAAHAVLNWHNIAGEVVVLGCDDARISALNADFRGKPRATNVLSWPSIEHMPRAPGTVPQIPDTDEFGDVAISYDTCVAEALAQEKPLSDHVTHLLVHAVLHLLGYDHEDADDADLMEETERRILAAMDIPDPYSEKAI